MVIGNYKLHCGVRESAALARGVLRGLRGGTHVPDVVLLPSFPALGEVRKVVARTHVLLGAQNLAPVAGGALTGEVSAAQLKDAGCAYVLVGHSERRRVLGETDTMVHDKLVIAYAASVTPILCVGEDAVARGAGQAQDVVAVQLTAALTGVTVQKSERVMIAYEPVWAIGTGDAATPGDVVAMHQHIRRVCKGLLGDRAVDVVYGGSVDGKNAYDFLRERDVDGVLVGSASVKLAEFLLIIAAAAEVMQAQDV